MSAIPGGAAPFTGGVADAAAPVAAEQVVAAAEAAAALLPVPAPSEVRTAATVDVPDGHVAVVAEFSGAVSGTVAATLTPEAEKAVTGGAPEPVDLAQALRPALEAAAGVLGPVALAETRVVSAPQARQRLERAPGAAAVAVITSEGEPAAYLLLAASPSTGGAAIPKPRGAATGRAAAGQGARGMDVLRGVTLEVTAEIGRTRMSVAELLALATGAVVELDRPVGSPADLLVNGRRFARGEVVVVDEDFAVRITEVLDPDADGT